MGGVREAATGETGIAGEAPRRGCLAVEPLSGGHSSSSLPISGTVDQDPRLLKRDPSAAVLIQGGQQTLRRSGLLSSGHTWLVV